MGQGVFFIETDYAYQVFGAPQPGVTYRDRAGAYGIAFDGQGRASVVFAQRKGYFLLGGGIDPGESEEDCIRREVLEETGLSVTVGKKVAVGEEYTADLRGGPYHPTGHIYLVELGEQIALPSETDHFLTWMDVREFCEQTVLKYQAWAMEVAWAEYQKQQKERVQ